MFNKKHSLVAITMGMLLGGSVALAADDSASPATAKPAVPGKDHEGGQRVDVKKEHGDLDKDRHDLRSAQKGDGKDHKDLEHDREALRKDLKNGDKDEAKRVAAHSGMDVRDLHKDHGETRQDRREVQDDRKDAQHDSQKDRGEAREGGRSSSGDNSSERGAAGSSSTVRSR